MTPIIIRLAGLLVLCGSSDLFISLCNAALKPRLGGKPLPILTQTVIDYRHSLLLLAAILLGWTISFLRSEYRTTKHIQIFNAAAFTIALIIISIIAVALPLPFMSLLSVASE
jgi:hypothetical protein